MSTTGKQQQNSNSAVPVVRWKAKAPSESPQALSDNDDEEEEVPQVKWRVKQIPSDNSSAGSGGGMLKIKWNPATAGQYSSSEDEIGGGFAQPQQQKRQQGGRVGGGMANGVPVVKWKAKVPEESESGGGDVPVVKWKVRVPIEPEPQGEDVPVVKWKAKTPTSNNGDVPVVKWKARVPVEPELENEDVPVVKWKAKVPVETTPKNEDVPVVRWKAKVPVEPEPQQNEDVPVVRWKAKMPSSGGTGSPPNQKRGIASARGHGRGLAPPSRRAIAMHDESENSEEGVLNGDSEQSGSEASSVENLRISRYTAHQSGLQKRSPPKAQQSGLAPPRQGSRNLSPSSRTSSNSNQASGASRSPSSSPGGGLRHPRKQLHSPSSPSPGQRVGGGKPPSSGLAASQQSRGGGLAVPRTQGQNSGAGSPSQQQRTFGLKESRSSPSSGAPAPARSGVTPPNGQGKARRMLPTPPSTSGGSAVQQQRVKQGAIQGTATKR